MIRETGTLFLDWVDHLMVSKSQTDALQKFGYRWSNGVIEPLSQTG
jgi:hypothetical protein